MHAIGKQVYLVPFDKYHLNDKRYFSWLRDYEVVKYLGREEYLEPISFEEVTAYVENLWKDEYCSFFAICLIEKGLFIGTAKINFLNEVGYKSQTADVGIMIGDRNYWGKGIATDALRTICVYAFDKLKVRKLTAGAVSANHAVIRAFEKIGFKQEARLREKLLISGKFYDHVLMGCFNYELVNEPIL